MYNATSGPVLEAFLVSKLGTSWLVGKPCHSSFWNNLIFLIWSSFSPPKVDSPKIASRVAKKWQRGHFLGVFYHFGGPNLIQIS